MRRKRLLIDRDIQEQNYDHRGSILGGLFYNAGVIRFANRNYLEQEGSINKKLSSLISTRERV